MSISTPVKRKDHEIKACGKALYASDVREEGLLWGRLLRSPVARGRIVSLTPPPLPEGYFFISAADVPGKNAVHHILDDMPVFAGDTVEFIGDPIAMIAGPDVDEAERLVKAVSLEIEELEPCLDMEDPAKVFFEYKCAAGDTEAAFADADRVFEERFSTGYQEQAYIEPQCLTAVFDGKRVTVRGSMQCPYYVRGAVAMASGLEAENVRIIQDVTGGGFGGKEDFPSILGCQLAVAAMKTGKSVRALFGRREDMEFTSKRHPSLCSYKVAVKNGRITAIDADVIFNAGAYSTLSGVVLQRGVISAMGVYGAENFRVRGRAVKTNTIHCGAFRGFGTPQTVFAIETMMDHIASQLGVEPAEFKRAHMVKQGDATATGGKYHYPVPLEAMLKKAMEESDYLGKRERYASQTGRFRRGIGLSMFFHGAGFTGSGERLVIKAKAGLRKNADGTVDILASNADIGQGVKTTFSKIVARELGCPLDSVRCENPDTDLVPDSGPTVASRSVMVVGELLRRAALKLKAQWRDGEEQTVSENYSEPDFMFPFDMESFTGDAYPTYAWGVNVMEAEVDTLTAKARVTGAWGVFDAGTPIDETVLTGQMEGGLLQSIGYASMEKMYTDSKGRLKNAALSDYLIPTAQDVPQLHTYLHCEPYPYGPYGAKGAGELPLDGGAPAYVQAVEQAAGISLGHIPVTFEDIYKGLEAKK